MGRHPNAKLTPRGRKTLVPRMESAPRSWMPPARWVSAAKPPASGCRAAGPARHPPTGTAAPGGSRSPRPRPDHAPYATSGSARASSSTSTSRKRRAYPTAAGNARWGADACRRTAPGVVPARRCRRPQRGHLRRATARRAPGRLSCLIEHCIGTVRTARTGTLRPCRASSA